MKKGSTSAQSAKITQSDLLRRLTIPRLIALETMSQDLVRREKRPEAAQTHVVPKVVRRLPILGLRSQREFQRGRVNQSKKELYVGYSALFNAPKDVPGTKSVCQRRSERRSVLFKMGIAGKGRRRSPGVGGTYKRSVDSVLSCKVYRR